MNDSAQDFADGTRQFATILAALAAGALLGVLLGWVFAPDSASAMVAGALLFPATLVLGWMMMFPLALLMLPFAIPGFIRWLREPLPRVKPPRKTAPAQASAAGWIFVLAALPTSLTAGVIAGAPFWYLLAGLLYGYGLRRSAAMLDSGLQ